MLDECMDLIIERVRRRWTNKHYLHVEYRGVYASDFGCCG